MAREVYAVVGVDTERTGGVLRQLDGAYDGLSIAEAARKEQHQQTWEEIAS